MDIARCGIASSRVIINLKRELCQVANDIMVSVNIVLVHQAVAPSDKRLLVWKLVSMTSTVSARRSKAPTSLWCIEPKLCYASYAMLCGSYAIPAVRFRSTPCTEEVRSWMTNERHKGPLGRKQGLLWGQKNIRFVMDDKKPHLSPEHDWEKPESIPLQERLMHRISWGQTKSRLHLLSLENIPKMEKNCFWFFSAEHEKSNLLEKLKGLLMQELFCICTCRCTSKYLW